MARGRHDVHTEQGGDEQHVELAFIAACHFVMLNPRLCHDGYDERTASEDELHGIGSCRGDIETSKHLDGLSEDTCHQLQ